MLTKDDMYFTIMKAYLNDDGKLDYKTTARLRGSTGPVLVGHFEGNRKDQFLIGNKCYSFDDELVKHTSLDIESFPENGNFAVIDVDGDKYDDVIIYDKKRSILRLMLSMLMEPSMSWHIFHVMKENLKILNLDISIMTDMQIFFFIANQESNISR